MLTRFVAKSGLLVAQMALSLANYWFTFRLWPVSWLSFVLCTVGSVVIVGVSIAIDAQKE